MNKIDKLEDFVNFINSMTNCEASLENGIVKGKTTTLDQLTDIYLTWCKWINKPLRIKYRGSYEDFQNPENPKYDYALCLHSKVENLEDLEPIDDLSHIGKHEGGKYMKMACREHCKYTYDKIEKLMPPVIGRTQFDNYFTLRLTDNTYDHFSTDILPDEKTIKRKKEFTLSIKNTPNIVKKNKNKVFVWKQLGELYIKHRYSISNVAKEMDCSYAAVYRQLKLKGLLKSDKHLK